MIIHNFVTFLKNKFSPHYDYCENLVIVTNHLVHASGPFLFIHTHTHSLIHIYFYLKN